jgi:hypothetical protein
VKSCCGRLGTRPTGESQGLQIGERGARAQYRSEQMGLRRLGTESSPDLLVEGSGFEPSVLLGVGDGLSPPRLVLDKAAWPRDLLM